MRYAYQTYCVNPGGNFNTDIIQALLAHGVNVSLPNNEGDDALKLAMKTGKPEVIKLLTDYIAIHRQNIAESGLYQGGTAPETADQETFDIISEYAR